MVPIYVSEAVYDNYVVVTALAIDLGPLEA
jgi:hypothetical protein